MQEAEFDLRDHKEVEAYLRKVGFSKRRFLRISKTLFDPQGLLTPIHQAFNILFREVLLYHPGHYKWDTHIESEFIGPFCQIVESLFYAKRNLKVRRSVCPPLATKNVQTTVINIMDGSMVGGAIALTYLHHEYQLYEVEGTQVD